MPPLEQIRGALHSLRELSERADKCRGNVPVEQSAATDGGKF
jgi:hypothetical protein